MISSIFQVLPSIELNAEWNCLPATFFPCYRRHFKQTNRNQNNNNNSTKNSVAFEKLKNSNQRVNIWLVFHIIHICGEHTHSLAHADTVCIRITLQWKSIILFFFLVPYSLCIPDFSIVAIFHNSLFLSLLYFTFTSRPQHITNIKSNICKQISSIFPIPSSFDIYRHHFWLQCCYASIHYEL